MDTSNQAAFISKVRSALGHSSDQRRPANGLFTDRPTPEINRILKRIKNRCHAERQQLLGRLIEMAEPINLNVVALKDPPSVAAALADLIRDKEPEWGHQKSVVTWAHPLIESLNLPVVLADQNVPVYITELKESEADEKFREKERKRLRKHIVDSYIGVTSADFCMAETASLVMRTRPGQARSVSLVPSIHIAVIHLDQIIADLKELYALIQWDTEGSREGLTNCMTFISGPSKTADVEATMVHGAHGPREVYIYVVTDS
ncbi:MAG: lactate utilization protein [Desulfobacterales bacterium]|jgi:L-lactate dehydrogenase complex protein LldG